jgi:hypothetical protein
MNNTKKHTNEKENMFILMMGFYGNRTMLNITREKLENKSDGVNLEHYILGILETDVLNGDEKFDTTIIPLPETNNLVLIYNKYQEEDKKGSKDKLNPFVYMPEYGIEIYSRCAICKKGNDGKLYGIEPEDLDNIVHCLAK